MKKTLFLSLLFTIGIIVSSYALENPKTTTVKTKNETSTTKSSIVSQASTNGPEIGTYKASGKITFTSGGLNYSCSISKVIVASTSLTIQTSTAEVKINGSLTVTCYTAKSAITTGTYSASSAEKISSVTYIDKNVNPYSATATTSGSSCSVNITSLTSTSIKGTFTATAVKLLEKSILSITGGIIDCTITPK